MPQSRPNANGETTMQAQENETVSAESARKSSASKLMIIAAVILGVGLFWQARDTEPTREIIVVNGQVTVVFDWAGSFTPKKSGVAFHGKLKGYPASPDKRTKNPPGVSAANQAAPRVFSPCETKPLRLAEEQGKTIPASSLFQSRKAEAAWLSAEAKQAEIAGFCIEDSGAYSSPLGFLPRSRVILTQPDTPTKSLLKMIARVSDKNYRTGDPDSSLVRKRILDMAERFDRQFPGRRMANAILFDFKEADHQPREAARKPKKAARASPRPAPPCAAQPIIRPTKWAEFAALSNPRGRSRFLTPAEGIWVTAEARRARVAGFCLMKNVRKICNASWAGACFIPQGRVIALQPDASILTLLHEIAHAADKEYSPNCPHHHGKEYQRKFVGLAQRFDRRFPERDMEKAVIREIRVSNPDYYKCHWKPKS